MAKDRTSPWVWVGIGCGTLVLLAFCTVAGGLWMVRKARQLEQELKDPETRSARALGILGADELPPGYHASVAFSIPLVAEFAILTDSDAGEGRLSPDLGTRGLIYFKTIGVGQDEQELRDYFTGRTSDPSVLDDNGIHLDAEEILGRGVVAGRDNDLMYVTQRGSVSAHGVSSTGLTSVILVDCPEDRKTRVAVWFGPDTDDDSLAGTPADEQAIASFMSRFSFCQ